MKGGGGGAKGSPQSSDAGDSARPDRGRHALNVLQDDIVVQSPHRHSTQFTPNDDSTFFALDLSGTNM